MKLPIIKHLTQFVANNDEDYIVETIETLEAICELPSIKDEELDVIGELLSNMHGALEVLIMMREKGMTQKDALNSFMKRVTSAIDR